MKTILKKNPMNPTELILTIDEKTKFCPYQQPVPMPGKLQGSVQFFQFPCGTHCPMCLIEDDVLNLACSNIQFYKISIETPEPMEPAKDSTIKVIR